MDDDTLEGLDEYEGVKKFYYTRNRISVRMNESLEIVEAQVRRERGRGMTGTGVREDIILRGDEEGTVPERVYDGVPQETVFCDTSHLCQAIHVHG